MYGKQTGKPCVQVMNLSLVTLDYVMLLVGLMFKMMTFMKLIKIISAIDCFKILHLIDALLDTSQCQTPFLDVEENVRLIVTVALEMSVISTGIWV